MIKVGIAGGAGYTAGELIRILVNHPHADIRFVQSTSSAGKSVTSVHAGLYGDTDMKFCFEFVPDDVDVLFLCMGHGDSARFLSKHYISDNINIIDLSQDFRDESNGFVYGLPELNIERLRNAKRVANPGCFATALQLALLPAIASGNITGDINVTALTGSTGAGAKHSASTHFSYRAGNISTYKEFNHQHITEISRNMTRFFPNGNCPDICFIPVRGDFTRGIFASLHFKSDIKDAPELYKEFYKNEAFTHYVEEPLDLKQVVNTNKALVHVERHGEYLHVTSVIDNLLKGASGQAVQNMNIMFGLPQQEGLRLKASAF